MDKTAEIVFEIMRENMHCKERLLTEENRKRPLTGSPFYFSAVDMMYLLLETEKRFGIYLEEEALANYRFSTIDQVVAAVNERLCESVR